MTREISRQAFVRGALGAAAGVLVGACRSTTGAQTASVAPSTTSPPVVKGPPDWGGLEDAIDGRVILPPNAGYAEAKNLFNTRFANSTPVAVLAVKSTDDVKKAVAFAAKYGVKIAARSGGHSYIGASAANRAMVIDLRQLPGGITYDDGHATVSAAADLNSVQTALAARGRLIPSGSCPTVGVAGLTLGGGLGSEARRSGLTCDALESALVVLPSGETVTASADDHADLFWALRGGGGGNCGVVTSFTFRTFPAPDRDVVSLVFPGGSAKEALRGWEEWLRGADREIWGMVKRHGGRGFGTVQHRVGDAGSRRTEQSA